VPGQAPEGTRQTPADKGTVSRGINCSGSSFGGEVEGIPVDGVAVGEVERQFYEVNNYFPDLAGLIWNNPSIQLLAIFLKFYILVTSTSPNF
jgi:hypothetical protein